ncbi:MAG: hypothetical protein [Circular genetic element sp.]|nr:MAG: hypothetical protein [Circular genetic element sp.]
MLERSVLCITGLWIVRGFVDQKRHVNRWLALEVTIVNVWIAGKAKEPLHKLYHIGCTFFAPLRRRHQDLHADDTVTKPRIVVERRGDNPVPFGVQNRYERLRDGIMIRLPKFFNRRKLNLLVHGGVFSVSATNVARTQM